jgi:hypothetical protein
MEKAHIPRDMWATYRLLLLLLLLVDGWRGTNHACVCFLFL